MTDHPGAPETKTRAVTSSDEGTASRKPANRVHDPERLRLLVKVALAAASSDSAEEALRETLLLLCEEEGWSLGHVYLRGETDAPSLAPTPIWYPGRTDDFRDFVAASEEIDFAPGEGVVGGILRRGEPVWVENLPELDTFLRRREARRAGLQSAYLFPIHAGGNVWGVVELFSRTRRPRDPEREALCSAVDVILGGVLRRDRDRVRLETARDRFTRLFHTMPIPAALTTAAEGRYEEVNDAFVSFLGYSREELLGRTVDEVGLWTEVESRDRMRASLIDRGHLPDFLTRVVTRGGDERTVLCSLTLLKLRGQDHVLGTLYDLTERARAQDQLRKSRVRIQALLHRLLKVQEVERARISRELHDQVGQALTAAKLAVGSLARSTHPGAVRSVAREAVGILDEALDKVRSLSFDLRPSMLDELGLSAALRSYCERHTRTADVELEMDVADLEIPLSDEVESTCFRIAQESVTNALRHAGPDRLEVSLKPHADHLELRVTDDGRGFEPHEPDTDQHGVHQGLLIMRERADQVGGSLAIDSAPDEGTTVVARLPLSRGSES